MKRFIAASLILVLMPFMTVASAGHGEPKDRPVPWPWGLEQPFPWTDIKGVWRIEKSAISGYFTFKVLRQKTGSESRYLVVKQIDPSSCDVIATGVAYELNKVVRGQMTNNEDGATFRIAVRAFREEDSPQTMAGPIVTEQVMVLSIMGLSDDSKVHVQIGKVQESIDLKRCSNLKK